MIDVTCAACRLWLGYGTDARAVDALLYGHDRTCPATDEQKRQAALLLRLRAYIAREGLDYEQ